MMRMRLPAALLALGVAVLMAAAPDAGQAQERPTVAVEASQAWAAVRDSTDAKDLETFIQHYGQTFYGDLARNRLEKVKQGQLAPPSAPVVPLVPQQGPLTTAPPIMPKPQAQVQPSIAGPYTVVGTNVKGKRYSGKVTIRGGGDNVTVNWSLTSGETYVGHGSMKGNVLTIDWGDKYPVIYRLESGTGALRGTWANGRGTEDLTPDR